MMRKRILCVLLSLCFFIFLIPQSYAVEPLVGEVLFAQRYGDFSDTRETGIRFGTGGGTPTLSLDGGLSVRPADDRKAYLLLPDAPGEKSWTDTYTVEFSFRFTEVSADNGYFGFLMTADGDVPSNRAELIFRAAGTVDGIGTLGETLASSVLAGEPVFVTVPVVDGMMYEVHVRCGGTRETLSLPAVKMIGAGSRGFVLRNASATVESVAVVSGVEYTKKLGEYASSSYKVPLPDEESQAPETPDRMFSAVVVAALAGGAMLLLRRRRV